MTRFRASHIGWLIVCVTAAAACGMKGPPLPPLQRVPAAAGELTAVRYDQDVFVSFVVPNANIEGVGAASIERVEVYAITLTAPLGELEAETAAVRKLATRIMTEHVRTPPPPPPDDPDEPPLPPPPPEPGLDQGGRAVAHERLTDAARAAVELPSAAPPPVDSVETPAEETVPMAAPTVVVADDTTAPRRYYFVVGVTRGGRYGRTSAPVAVPLSAGTGVTSAPVITYDERAMTIRWTPASDAHLPEEPAGDLLPSRPLMPGFPPTKYDVFAVSRTPAAAEAAPVLPVALNPEPLAAPELVVPQVRFGEERCFAVRPVDTIAGVPVRGRLSEPACETPRDTFPPAAPQALAAVAGAGSISLIWEPNSEADLAGYVVLRGEASSDRLTPLTQTPIRETTFRDANVTPGTRYIYAVVAVDNASPQNVSSQSARVEETARQ